MECLPSTLQQHNSLAASDLLPLLAFANVLLPRSELTLCSTKEAAYNTNTGVGFGGVGTGAQAPLQSQGNCDCE